MAWGGSLNKRGSDYIRMLRDADRVISFLERIKDDLNSGDQENLSKTVDIITNYISRISENIE